MKLIETQNLTKRYGRQLALDSVSLEINAGSPVALVGPNGAGKTTLMSLLCGFIHPDAGHIAIMGQAPGHRALLGKIAVLPQDALLEPHFSVFEQLCFFAALQGASTKAAKVEVGRVLELVGLGDIAHAKPATLSHGMGKRVAIAQALIGSPTLVLLDEPTAGLDPVNARAIRQLIASKDADTNFLISSHNLDELERLCDTVLYLDKGKLTQTLSLQSLQGKAPSNEAFLTLSLQKTPDQGMIKDLSSLPGVVDVKLMPNGTELIIAYQLLPNAHGIYALEFALFQLLEREGLHYRQLVNGKRLEDKLFT